MKFKIGTFYTENTVYEDIYRNQLLLSCSKLDLDIYAVASKNYGRWIRNVAEKPRIIGEMLDLFVENNERLCFLDVDCTIEKYPKLFEDIPEDIEIAYHILKWNEFYGYSHNPTKTELLTGTMLFKPTKKVKDLCKEWYEKSVKDLVWEQKTLQNIINKYHLKTYYLPLNYIWITSRPKNQPLLVKEPEDGIYIKHYQASRELKRKIL